MMKILKKWRLNCLSVHVEAVNSTNEFPKVNTFSFGDETNTESLKSASEKANSFKRSNKKRRQQKRIANITAISVRVFI